MSKITKNAFQFMRLYIVGAAAQDSKPDTATLAAGYTAGKYYQVQLKGFECSTGELALMQGRSVPASIANTPYGMSTNLTLTRNIFQGGAGIDSSLYDEITNHLSKGTKIKGTKRNINTNTIEEIDVLRLDLYKSIALRIDVLDQPVKQYRTGKDGKVQIVMAFPKKDPITKQYLPAQPLETTDVRLVLFEDEYAAQDVLMLKAKQRLGVSMSTEEKVLITQIQHTDTVNVEDDTKEEQIDMLDEVLEETLENVI